MLFKDGGAVPWRGRQEMFYLAPDGAILAVEIDHAVVRPQPQAAVQGTERRHLRDLARTATVLTVPVAVNELDAEELAGARHGNGRFSGV